MKKEKNPVWQFLASVRLALFTLFILAFASIIGTIIPQGKPYAAYVQQYGAGTAKLFQVLSFDDMYSSWWFVSLLVLFSFNLIVCTLERLPNIWRLVRQDNLETGPDRLGKMPQQRTFFSPQPVAGTAAETRALLAASGWRPAEKQGEDGGILLAAQKGAWTRLGVIAVHVSILVIFVGAIIGSIFGFKGSIMIPEGETADRIFAYDESNTPIPLPFQVRCDRFDIFFYDSGMPKEFESDLTVIKDGQEVYSKTIEVNDPMEYGGLTFYQSSYQGTKQLIARVENQKTGSQEKFSVPVRQEIKWAREGVSFGITNFEGPDFRGNYRFKIWFNESEGSPSEFWTQLGKTTFIERADASYAFTLKERYATGLQVAKDPGVWWVYIGCGLMLLGLLVAFFMSHARLWVHLAPENSGTRILLAGTSNKNKLGFSNRFEQLTERFEKSESLNVKKEV